MRLRFSAFLISLPTLLALSGCGYVHVGRIPATTTITTVIGDEKLLKDNSDLRLEKKMLQHELALTRAQGDALRMAIENRASDGDTSKRLVEKLNQTSHDLAALRANYATLQQEKNQAIASAAQASGLRTQLGATEEKLAASLRTFTELQEEVTRLRTDVVRTSEENVVLTAKVRTVTAQSEQAQAALAQLNTDLLAQREAGLRAGQDIESLRSELKTVAPNSSLLAQQRTGSAGQARLLTGEHAAENIVLMQQLDLLRTKVGTLETERAQLQKQLAAAGTATAPDAGRTEAMLVEATRVAAQLREENSQLKSTSASQVQTLQDQFRDAQARAVALTEENTRLKGRLASARPIAPTDSPRIELGSDQPVERSAASAKTGSSSVNATLVASAPGRVRTSSIKTDANGQRVHIVTGGDTLAKISALYYGTPARWGDILAANGDVLGENNNLVVGRPLRIP